MSAPLIGGLLIAPDRWDDCDFVTADMLADPRHEHVWSVMAELHRAGKVVDTLTVAEAGGGDLAYLTDLAFSTPSAANVVAYAEIVREQWRTRKLREVCAEVMASEGNSESLAGQLTRGVEALDATARGGPVTMADALPPYMDALDAAMSCEGLTGLGTGFRAFDSRTTGLHPGDLVVVAGRPGMGKTTWAMNAALHVALVGGSVDVFSLEMPRDQLLHRIVSQMTRTELQAVRSGKVDWSKVTEATARLLKTKLRIDDRSAMSPDQIRSAARRDKKKHGLQLVVVDYLQLMRQKAENRFQEVSEISRAMKAMAKDLGVPVILLSQLSRKCEERSDKTPMLSDLRESGQIEQDADVVVFLYRDEVYTEGSSEAGKCRLITAKQRNGPVGMDWLDVDLAHCEFRDGQPPLAPMRPKKNARGFDEELAA